MLQLVGPDNLTFCVTASCPDPQLWGMTPQEIAVLLWPQIAGYVADTIARLTVNTTAVVPPPAPISVPVIFS